MPLSANETLSPRVVKVCELGNGPDNYRSLPVIRAYGTHAQALSRRQVGLYVSKVLMATLKIDTARVYADALAGDSLAFFQSIQKSAIIMELSPLAFKKPEQTVDKASVEYRK
jgi:hypothetical protein